MQSDITSNDFEATRTSGAAGVKTPEADLEAQIAKLREDVAGVAEALKNVATERATGARQQAYALRDDVKDRGERYVKQAQSAVSDFEDEVSERVRAEPIKAVIIAAAVGYLYARIFH